MRVTVKTVAERQVGLFAWTAGVGAVAGSLAAAIASDKATWQRALFFTLVLIASAMFIVLVVVGVQAFSSWLWDRPRLWASTQDSEQASPELALKVAAVNPEDIDRVRIHDFTSPVNGLEVFGLSELELDDLEKHHPEKLLIEAPPGFGKTFLLRRIANNLSHIHNTFLVTCDKIYAPTLKNAKSDQLLYEIIHHSLGEDAAQNFRRGQQRKRWRVLILDGLNEIAADQESIQYLLDQAGVTDHLVVLASQRPNYTHTPPRGYVTGFLLPLEASFVKSSFGNVSDRSMGLLRIPLFYELRRSQGIEAATRADAVRTYFTRCLLGLPDYKSLNKQSNDVQQVGLSTAFLSIGEAAAAIYRERQSLTADRQFFTSRNLFERIGGIDKALEMGIIVKDANLIRFRHQLFHDWAIAKYYFDKGKLLSDGWWRNDLEIATLSRQSTDALEFLVQMHAQAPQGDPELVIRRIYDWDYPAAAASLISWERSVQSDSRLQSPPQYLEEAIFSLVAEKEFDLFQHTIRRFESMRPSVDLVLSDLLPGLPDRYTLDDLLAAVSRADAAINVPNWFKSWVDEFCKDVPFEQRLQLLESDEAVLAWTASNVIARSEINYEQLSRIRKVFDTFKSAACAGENEGNIQDHATTVCWRLVHAVGHSGVAVQFLKEVAGDECIPSDVRHGAVRSLLSIALSCKNADVARSSIDAVLSLDKAGLFSKNRVASAVRLCSIPAQHVNDPMLRRWIDSFDEMFNRHAQKVDSSDPVEIAAWGRRMKEFEEWKELQECE